MRLTALVTHEPPWYVVRCVEIDAVAQGDSVEAATENLRAALADAEVPIVSEPPLVTEIEVSARATARADMGAVDRDGVVRRAVAAGWRIAEGGVQDVLRGPSGVPVVALPHGVEQIAVGVFRVLAGATVTREPPDATSAFGRLDALFARHPHDDDTTRLVREERDGR